MAYTITAVPFAYASVHGDLIFTVAYPDHVSDPVTYPNYKFIGDVYVGGVLVARLKKFPDPITGIGIFNIGTVVRNYMATQFDPTAGLLNAQELGDTEARLSVQMKFGEEYTFASFLDVIVDSPRFFFNCYNDRRITSSVMNDITDRVASHRPPYGYLQASSQYYFIPYFPLTTTPVLFSVTPDVGSSFSTTIPPAAGSDIILMNVSPGALNAVHPGCITAATTSYVVTIGSQSYTIYVFCEPMYTPFTLHFLNQYGGFDTFIFRKVSRVTTDITKSTFSKIPYMVDASGNVSYKNANGIVNESKSVYASQYNEKVQLNSDLLTDFEYAWLNDLMISPMVFMEDSGLIYPITITDNNYETKKNINDDLTNLTINVEFGVQTNAQYR